SYNPQQEEVDANTSATTKYNQERGFGYTYRNGKKIDCTYLHMLEWINGIRQGVNPSCNVQQGFEESITYIMSNVSYLEQRTVNWAELQKLNV
ncbi:MAG: gfo/Idh/MocA family oxidoreductase, partial [Candidatus Cyclobacteriaceae bacterium M3_2C_046]